MKNLVVLLMLIGLITACSKNEPELSLADQAAGNYEANAMVVSGTPLALPFQSGNSKIEVKLVIAKVTETSVDMTILLYETANGKTTEDKEVVSNITLTKNADGSIQMYEGTSKIGNIIGKSLSYETVVEGIEATLKAEKK
jgi:hypothetical protein